MMFWLGKCLGALFGFLLAGPFGAVFGLLLGHYFDNSLKGHWFFTPLGQHTPTQDIFFQATFTIMGYIAKADGRISENEIRVASHIMRNMMLTTTLRRQAIDYFRLGKEANFDLDQMLQQLYHACGHQRDLLHLFLKIQFQAAYADGVLSAKKQPILQDLCYRLGFNISDFYLYDTQNTRRNSQQASYQPRIDPLEKAYHILGVSSTTNPVELKKAYRRLISQNHPDKLVSKGLPEEMIKLATQKTQEIKAAYELVRESRGF